LPVRAPSLFMAWNIATMGRTLPGLQYSTSRTSSIGTSRVGMSWDRHRGDLPRSFAVVLVMTAPPEPRLVAPLRRAVEPLVHAPEAVQSARIGGIGVVDDAVLERERAHARCLSRIRCGVGSDHGRHLGDRALLAGLQRRNKTLWAEVVIGDSRPLLLLRVGR